MKQNMEQQLNQLKSYYIAQLPNKIAAIESTWLEYRQQPTPEKLQILYRQAHNLSGSAGTYGYKDLSDTAKKMDKILRENRHLNYEDQEKISKLIEQLSIIYKKIKKHARP